MMILQVHIGEPLQQLLPVIPPLLFGTIVPSPALLIPILLRQLRLVIRLRSWTELIMQLFLNGLFRRKPPLYSVQDPSRRTPIWRVLVLARRPMIPGQATANSVVINKTGRGRCKTGRRWR